MPSVGSSLAVVTAAASTRFVPDLRSVLVTCFKSLFPLWVASQLFRMSGREDRYPPDGGGGRGNREDNCLAVAEVHPGNGRPGGRTARNVISDDARLLDDVALVLPTTATGRERSPTHAIRKRVNSSPEGVWW